MKKILICLIAVALSQNVNSQNNIDKDDSTSVEPKNATVFTIESNLALKDYLSFSDTTSFYLAQKGFIAPIPSTVIKKDNDQVVWDPNKYAFVKQGSEAPFTVNPGLWRQSQLVSISGLFKVSDRIYQIRNYDLSNLTVIEGDSGLIVIDPLISMETAKASMDLYFAYRPKKPVVAVIHSHSHIDHFGGVKGKINFTIGMLTQVKLKFMHRKVFLSMH